MNTMRFTRDEEAVHPGIAVIPMIAITFVLAAVLYTTGCGCSDMQTPTVVAVYQPYDGNFSVHIEKVDPAPVNIIHVNYILLDDRGTAVPGEQGSLRDIYDLDIENENTNITFQDRDRDGKISAGDMFIIKSKENGGQATAGYSLLLRYDRTGESMNGGGTRLG